MAIKKQDAAAQLTKAQQNEVRALEHEIDAAITACYDGEPLHIEVDPPNSRRVCKALKERYAAAGWKLSFHYDQREGGWIELR